MSLIEEALRKQREDTEKTQPKLQMQVQPPPLPPEAREQPPEEQPEAVEDAPVAAGEGRSWKMLAMIALGGLVAVILVVLLLAWGFKLWQGQPTASGKALAVATPVTPAATPTPPSPSQAAPAPAPAQEPAPAAAAPTSAPAAASAAAPAVAAPSPAPAATPGPAPAAPAPASPKTTPPAAAKPPAAAAPAAPATADAEPVRITTGTVAPDAGSERLIVPVAWPKLSVAGVSMNARTGKGAAIINGQMLNIGDVVEGVKIVGVEKSGVKLSLGGETRVLAVGGSTE